jgi:hypothetical protein
MIFTPHQGVRWKEHVARREERRSAHRVLVDKSDSKRPLGRISRRTKDNIERDLQEVGWWQGQNWSGSG